MSKGFYTQSACFLTDGRTTIDDVKAALARHKIEVIKETPAGDHWAFSGPSVLIAFNPKQNGYAVVDVVNQPWPDAMGDPKSDPMVFGAWTMGHFGPLTFPGGLGRAAQHSWSWEPGRTIAGGHRGFVRVQLSYILGKGGDAPIMPADYDPLAEMLFMGQVVIALAGTAGVLCHFNPNGEILRDAASFTEYWTACRAENHLPLALWMNVRFFNLSSTLTLMDTVGNGQLDLRDIEAIYPSADYDPGDIDYYLRNVTLYLKDLDRELKTGESIDGPGERNLTWTIEVLDEGVVSPPRRIVRLSPKASQPAIRAALKAVGK